MEQLHAAMFFNALLLVMQKQIDMLFQKLLNNQIFALQIILGNPKKAAFSNYPWALMLETAYVQNELTEIRQVA